MNTELSVIICTWNRDAMLADTLASWREVVSGGRRVELVIVDNASTDGTAAVCAAFLDDAPGEARVVHEPQPGLSFARNRGLAESRAEIVAFVDDDVYFDPAWVRSVLDAFATHPGAGAIGGRSVPVFEVPRPRWVHDSMFVYYGSTHSGDRLRAMHFPEHPFGVNMAFRREVFDRVGGFRTDLGRIGASLLSNEEKDLFQRVHEAGIEVLYVPGAVIHHRVPAERVSKTWLLRRAYWQGISNVVFDARLAGRSRAALARTLWRSAHIAVPGALKLAAKRVLGRDPDREFANQLRVRHHLGVVRQALIELCTFRPTADAAISAAPASPAPPAAGPTVRGARQ